MTNSQRAALLPGLVLIGAAIACGITAAHAGPSLDLESNDAVIQPGAPCAAGVCGAMFNADLSGPPFGRATIGLCLSVSSNAAGCQQATGSGVICAGSTACEVACPVAPAQPQHKAGATSGAFNAAFVGELCQPEEGFYLLRGAVEMRPGSQCASVKSFAASGTLMSFGAVHIPGRPIPTSDPSVASIIGSSGQVPMCTP